MTSPLPARLQAIRKRAVASWDYPGPATIEQSAADVARLLAAVEAVVELAAAWESRGEHDMTYSKTIQDEDIAMALLTHGADMVENARHIRNALTDTLGDQR